MKSVNTLRDPDALTPLPERLAHVHNMFERIHPFLDGNGSTDRLLLNLILVRLGYPPAIIFKNERTKYLRVREEIKSIHYGVSRGKRE